MHLHGKFVVTVVKLLQLAKKFKTKSPVLLESQLYLIFLIYFPFFLFLQLIFSQSIQICVIIANKLYAFCVENCTGQR